MNPQSNGLANCLRAVVKQKVLSSLCNEESIIADRKKMFDDTEYEAQRSQNPGIEPAEIRLKNYQIKSFGSRYD